MKQYLTDFKLHNSVPTEVIEKYRNLVPSEVITLWSEYGFGTFMQGYIKCVNPEEYKDVLVESSQRYKNAVVLFATGMGDLIIWSEGYVRLLNYRYGVVRTIMFSFEFFFQNITDEDFREEDLSWKPFPEALEQFNELDYDECFGYTPLLGLGGSEKVDNLKKVKLKEHILIITEFMGPIQ
ncbi:T6SS immunity protein Tdi1 domain-containing protein [Metabacillus indicus]|uniref:T6SS immunity protein Tdi1 domain-containing protein n=1 Tax=Metabacillus indicus TaxID=246786 RepID=UPI00317BBD70